MLFHLSGNMEFLPGRVIDFLMSIGFCDEKWSEKACYAILEAVFGFDDSNFNMVRKNTKRTFHAQEDFFDDLALSFGLDKLGREGGRRDSSVVCASDSGPEGREFELAGAHPRCVLRQNTQLSQCLSPPRCINGNHQIAWGQPDKMMGGNLRWTSIPSRGSRNTPSRFTLQKPEISPGTDESPDESPSFDWGQTLPFT